MSKEKQRLKRARRKKRIYSKDKTPIVEMPFKPRNSIQVAQFFYGKHDIWSLYIDMVVFGNAEIDLPPEENISILVRHMSMTLRQQVIRRLMRYKEYNPFKDNIPLDIFEENIKRSIEKVQRNLGKQRDAINKYSIRDIPIRRDGEEVRIACFVMPKENINEYLFGIGYDIIMLHEKGEYIIISNPRSGEDRILFDDIYEVFERSEEDTWYLHGHKGMIKTKNNRFSKLPLRQVVQYIKRL